MTDAISIILVATAVLIHLYVTFRLLNRILSIEDTVSDIQEEFLDIDRRLAIVTEYMEQIESRREQG